VVLPALAALGLGGGMAIAVFSLALRAGRFPRADAAALAAHYGSASAVTSAAATRMAIPEANTCMCVAAALGITFPFNLALGIPLYAWCGGRDFLGRVFKNHFPFHSERSEESTGTAAPLPRRVTAAGFFAPLRMTKHLKTRPGHAVGIVP
jgi:hypothetical protein